MQLLPSSDYEGVFDAIPGAFLVLLPDAVFTIVGVSNAYLEATLTGRAEILGKSLFEVFPDNPATPDAHSTRNLLDSLQRVVATRRPDLMALQR